MTVETATERGTDWKATACILCECNCGILVKLGGENGRRFEQIRGDKAHPASKGYTCQKALRLDHYQNGRGERVLRPLRRRRRAVSHLACGAGSVCGRESTARRARDDGGPLQGRDRGSRGPAEEGWGAARRR